MCPDCGHPRYRERGINLYFRADAAFAKPEIYERLEQEGIQYAIRLPANDVLQRRIGHLLTRAGRAAAEEADHLLRQLPLPGQGVGRDRVLWWPKSSGTRVSCIPRVGFIVTNLSRPSERVVKFYNGRGTAEQWIKEGKNALRWTRLSCRAFRHNTVRLQLHALAYNIANFLRTLALPKEIEQWSLTTLREKLVKIGARIVPPRIGRGGSSWPRWQCRGSCSPRSCVASTACGYVRRRSRHEEPER